MFLPELGRGECWFQNPKPVLECWEEMRYWGVCFPPPLAQSNRVSWYTDKSETKHALTSCDIAQVKLKVFPVTVKIVEVMAVVADQNFFPLLQ